MKKQILFCVFFMLCNSVYGQSVDFYEKAVSHIKCRSCYFIPVSVKSQSFSGKIVVDNNLLFSYMKSVKGFDEKAYIAFMMNLFRDNQALIMDGVSLDEEGSFLVGNGLNKYSFRVVETSQEFETVSSQGCEKIIQYYFSPELPETNKKTSCKEKLKLNAKDVLFRPKFDLNEQNNVILKLFEMEIPIYLDDISGSLKIGYLTLR